MDPEHDKTLTTIRDILRVAEVVYPIPWFAKWLAAVVVATLVVLIQRIDVGKLLAAWAKAANPGPVPQAPPLPMPEGGLPLDQVPMEPQP